MREPIIKTLLKNTKCHLTFRGRAKYENVIILNVIRHFVREPMIKTISHYVIRHFVREPTIRSCFKMLNVI